jgi:hypothetical protein
MTRPAVRVSFILVGTHSATIRLTPQRRAALIDEARAVAVEQGAFDAQGNGAIP